MKNIEELNATIEELEKRIKAISSAGATLAQIIAVRDSLEQVKVCLNNLTTAIKDEEDDASVAQLTALEQRVATAETDITTLQTDLTSTQDDLETVWNNLASTNSVVGEHTTTLTNLQTAQTNLQTTQTNQASTITTNTTDISNLKTRMTTAENNISTLTGGVDVSAIDERLNEVEKETVISVFDSITQNIYQNFAANTMYYLPPIHTYSNDYNRIQIRVDYNIEAIENTVMNVYLSRNTSSNTQLLDEQTLNICPSCKYYSSIFTLKNVNEIYDYQIRIKSEKTIKINKVNVTYLGKNAFIQDYNEDYKVFCYNNNIYLTKINNDTFSFDKFTIDNISLTNFTNTITNNGIAGQIHDLFFLPKYTINSSNEIDSVEDVLITKDYNNKLNIYKKTNNDFSSLTNILSINLNYYIEPVNNLYNNNLNTYVTSDGCPQLLTCYSYTLSSISFNKLSQIKSGKWKMCFGVNNNNYTSSSTFSNTNYPIVALHNDGYFYFIPNKDTDYIVKIDKGQFATAYIQPNGKINIYISHRLSTRKYTLNLDSTGKYYLMSNVNYISNASKVYELYNNKILKKANNKWSIETLNY